MKTICEASYAQGRAAFNSGASLRSIVERVVAADNEPSSEVAEFSRAIGFADALLDRLRNTSALTKAEVVEIVRDAELKGALK
ncbi:hypothetical protein X566_01500 [Afipia sp. P52-10]|uniref:hypothetical protein n=1 Tax=Afipia sp. P52-10 TaxID=1429916 RepID=UPI0003DEFBB5|nr:hypothetical protein [Afipia sp. P52-10]ETR79326.1 hypothetical protein X566_01500 [Afipia sp. P52-10]